MQLPILSPKRDLVMACRTPPQRYAITHAQFKEQFLLSSYTENGDIMVMSPMFHHKPPHTHMLQEQQCLPPVVHKVVQ